MSIIQSGEQASSRSYGLVPPQEAAQLSGLEFLLRLLDGRFPSPPFSEATDITPVSVERGRIVFQALPSARFNNPMGLVHGGWISTLLDTAMGCAVHSALEPGLGYTTTDLRTTFVKAVRDNSGPIRCEATLLHIGGRTASSEGRVYDQKGTLLAHGSESCLIFPIGANS